MPECPFKVGEWVKCYPDSTEAYKVLEIHAELPCIRIGLADWHYWSEWFPVREPLDARIAYLENLVRDEHWLGVLSGACTSRGCKWKWDGEGSALTAHEAHVTELLRWPR